MEGERFITPADLPTERQREILTVLIEEAAEVQHRATKALRFGLSEIQPGQDLTNAERLSVEIGDFRAVITMAVGERMLSLVDIQNATNAKEPKLKKYMQTDAPPRDPSWDVWANATGPSDD